MKLSPSTSLALLLSLSPLCATAHAQPDTANAPKADNPANRTPRRQMTPEQRMQLIIKAQFARMGANDAAQTALATFVQSELQARQLLAEKAQPLQTALRAEALSDTQIAALLNTYQAALEDDKTRHLKAVAELEKAVDLKKLPKIEATLVLLGVLGDGPPVNFGGRRGTIGGAFGGGIGRGQGRANRNNAEPNNVPAQGA